MEATIEWTEEDRAQLRALKESADAREKLYTEACRGLSHARALLENGRDELGGLIEKLSTEGAVEFDAREADLLRTAVGGWLLTFGRDDLTDQMIRDRSPVGKVFIGHGRIW